MGLLDGKIALVTGAGSGIGRTAALAFAREGARVVAADVVDGGEEVARAIRDGGGQAEFLRADVASQEDVRRMVAVVVERFGRLDCAFNNAGVGGASASTADYTLEDWNRVLSVNLTGVWLCMKHELLQMRAQGSGVIVNNASILGLVGFRNAPAYVASKHAVLGLTKTAALENARSGIRVTAVCPGFIHTPMVDRGLSEESARTIAGQHAMGRMGTPEEVADAVVWLCCDQASFVTGQPLVIDGGYVSQ
ncbi:MAG TPA: glucose 1-dehydrogenase [Thermomicrobiaceae bacterium]|nr:glucose 1-dehydrogenase [Thermomicrobiaceae bacterium]